MTSKFALPARWKYVVRHSITNCRFGWLPVTAVKMPEPAVCVSRSSWYGMKERSSPLIGSAEHPADEPPFDVRN